MKTNKSIVILSTLLSLALLFLRIIITGSFTYTFLIWNLFLAWIPLFLSSYLIRMGSQRKLLPLKLVVVMVWILFLPNAPYLTTDLYHLSEIKGAPLWFDLTLLLFFVITGLIFWIKSVRQIQKKYMQEHSRNISNLFLTLIILLSSFGVYIGRYLRWNSWDIFIRGPELIGDIFLLLIHPLKNSAMYSMTFVFSVFLGFIYYMISKLKSAENN